MKTNLIKTHIDQLIVQLNDKDETKRIKQSLKHQQENNCVRKSNLL